MKNKKWLIAPLMYVTICVYTYFSADISVDGIELPRHEAGMWGLVSLHVMALLALIGAYVLHWVVEALVWITEKLFK